MEEKKKWAGWLVLAVIVLVAAAALAMTALGDEGDDAMPAELRTLFPEADEGASGFATLPTNSGLGFVYSARQNGTEIGRVGRVTVEGYAGPIDVTVGVESGGVLRGVVVGGDEFQESEDLGAKAREPAFTDQFAGKEPPVALGEGIDGISGATITSRAVVDGVNRVAQTVMGEDTTMDAQPNVVNVSTLGYAGPVLVRVQFDAQGAIEALDVGGVRFEESEGVGDRVRKSAFTDAFIGKVPPLTLGEDVDGITGATVSSTAVVDAVNEAAAFRAE